MKVEQLLVSEQRDLKFGWHQFVKERGTAIQV